MSIEAIKQGTILKLIRSSEPIPEGTRLTLYTLSELEKTKPDAWEAAQLDCVFQEDTEDWGTSLDQLVKGVTSK